MRQIATLIARYIRDYNSDTTTNDRCTTNTIVAT